MKTITALLGVAALALAACGSSNNSNTAASSSGSSNSSSGRSAYGYGGAKSAKTTAAANSSASSSKTIAISMRDYSFGPKVITGKPGSTVKVKLTNTSADEHNFKIDGQKAADADVAPGKTGTATVIVPKSGSIQFYCEYHRGLGMTGTVNAA